MSNPSTESVRREAEERVERAAKYAFMFPHLIKEGEERFQDVNWQEDYLRKMYKLPPLERVNSEGKVVNTAEDVNRKAYMKDYMAKRRALKRGDKIDSPGTKLDCVGVEGCKTSAEVHERR